MCKHDFLSLSHSFPLLLPLFSKASKQDNKIGFVSTLSMIQLTILVDKPDPADT